MIRSSKFVAVSALLTATALHGAYLFAQSEAETVETAGGAPAAAAAMGNAFADLVAGAASPVTPDFQGAEPVNEQATAEPSNAPAAAPPEKTPPLKPDTAPTATAPTSAATAQPAPAPQTQTLRAQMPKPERVAALKPVEKVEEPEKQETKQAVPRQKPSGGNAKVDARKGSDNGSANQTAAASSKAKSKASETGNAALSNYKGLVFRKIARAKRSKVRIKGAVLVSLTIAGNGALTKVRIYKSSGSAKLDQVAVAQVKRAAPFQPPPDSAAKTYVVKVKGS